MDYKRIGIARGYWTLAPNRTTETRPVCGVFIDPEFPDTRYMKYEGHDERDLLSGALVSVGLPSAGVPAWWRQPLLTFTPKDYASVTIFEEK